MNENCEQVPARAPIKETWTTGQELTVALRLPVTRRPVAETVLLPVSAAPEVKSPEQLSPPTRMQRRLFHGADVKNRL